MEGALLGPGDLPIGASFLCPLQRCIAHDDSTLLHFEILPARSTNGLDYIAGPFVLSLVWPPLTSPDAAF